MFKEKPGCYRMLKIKALEKMRNTSSRRFKSHYISSLQQMQRRGSRIPEEEEEESEYFLRKPDNVVILEGNWNVCVCGTLISLTDQGFRSLCNCPDKSLNRLPLFQPAAITSGQLWHEEWHAFPCWLPFNLIIVLAERSIGSKSIVGHPKWVVRVIVESSRTALALVSQAEFNQKSFPRDFLDIVCAHINTLLSLPDLRWHHVCGYGAKETSPSYRKARMEQR